MEFAITRVSTKGQIVIPFAFRNNINTGDELLLIKDKDRIILKDIKTLIPGFKKDLEFAKKVEDAWEKYDKGKFKTTSKEDFLKELEKC
jgi:AbrB family looped-hinge helix DNA binding protein